MADSFDPYYKWLGIPPTEQPPHHYRLLAIKVFEQDQDVIANAADRQMAHLRTFQAGVHTDLSQQLLNEVSAARLCLLSADKKSAYDEQLRAKLKPKARPKVDAAQSNAAKTNAQAAGKSGTKHSAPLDSGYDILADIAASQSGKLAVKQEAVATPTQRGKGASVPKKRQSQSPPLQKLVAAGAVGTLVLIAALVYFMYSGKDKPPVAKSNGAKQNTKASAKVDAAPSSEKPLPTLPTSNTLSPDPLLPTPLTAPVDLLKLIDAKRDAVYGVWRRDGNDLVAPKVAAQAAVLKVPFVPPPEYLLTVVATWQPRLNTFNLGLPIGGQQTVLSVDHFGTHNISGLELIDGKRADVNETRRVNRFLTPDKRLTFLCAVRGNRVQVTCDGQPVVNWTGNPWRLSADRGWGMHDKQFLYVAGWDSGYRIHKLEIAPLARDLLPPATTPSATSTDPLAGLRPGAAVDLLQPIDPARDSVRGTWTRQGNALVVPKLQGALLQIPVTVPRDYRLSIDAERVEGNDALVVGLVIGGTQTYLALDGWGGNTSALCLKGKPNTNETTRPGRVIFERPSKLVFVVRQNRLEATCGDKPIFAWQGKPSELAVDGYWQVPDKRRLFIGGFDSSFLITKLQLEPLESSSRSPSTKSSGLVAGDPVNLLELVDPARDAVHGQWQREGESLISPTTEFARLQVPHAVPDEYELTAVVERLTYKEALGIGLVIGGHRAAAVLDGGKGTCSGLELIDNARFTDNSTTYRRPLFTEQRPYTIACTVRRRSVKVTCDGEMVFEWSGNASRLSMMKEFDTPDRTTLTIGSVTSYRISKLELRTLSGKTATRPTIATRNPTQSPSTPASRLAVPDAEAVKRAHDELRTKFADLYSKSAKPEGKLALAQKLHQQSGEAAGDPAARYATLCETRDLAAAAGDAKLALEACSALAESFDVDAWQLRADALAAAARVVRNNVQRRELALASLKLLDAAIAEDRYDAATELAKAAQTATSKIDDVELKRQTKQQRERVTALHKAWDETKPSVERLAKDPAEAEANLAVGRYRCFWQSDWERGLPLLAKGSDPTLRTLAEAELNDPAQSDDRVRLGDGWWEVGDKTAMPARLLVYEHAAAWYLRVVPTLDAGAGRTRIENRLEKLEALWASSGGILSKPVHPSDAIQFGPHWYKLFDDRLTWHQAVKRCNDLGGYLVCVESADENLFIKSMVLSDPKLASKRVALWLGASDENQTGVYRWVNGSRSTFTDWSPGQPDNQFGTEHYLGLMRSRFGGRLEPKIIRWNDYHGEMRHCFVCEWDR